jgi:hypothetical protein
MPGRFIPIFPGKGLFIKKLNRNFAALLAEWYRNQFQRHPETLQKNKK